MFAALSDGTKIKPLNAFKAIRGGLAKAQRKLARKTKFSANWKKQKGKITRLHMRAANARKDFLQKLSTDLAKSHSVIKIEKLQIQNMTRSARGSVDRPGTNVKAKSRLNRSILDQGWGMFARMLNYKLAERGGRLVYVNPPYTSQTCAECQVIHKASRIDQARFVCAHCGHEDNADINGARNIHQARALASEPPERILRRVGKRKHPERDCIPLKLGSPGLEAGEHATGVTATGGAGDRGHRPNHRPGLGSFDCPNAGISTGRLWRPTKEVAMLVELCPRAHVRYTSLPLWVPT